MNDVCIPDLAVPRFENIDFSKVLTGPRRYLCLDLDNTLITQYGMDFAPQVLEKLEEIRSWDQLKDICLVSNVIFPGRRVSRLRVLADKLKIKNVVPCYFFGRKPKPAPYRKALSLMNSQPEETVFVGDQIFTDIVGANRLGFYTIWLMDRMSADHWTTKMTGRRKKEDKIREVLKQRGLL